ncbi:MAG: winged helix DNA-binding domain-containing protein [Chloroflexi bacterium]|nr:winged helix DNA-binding domain-containing protein [Chloroflexota bacterium]
MLSISKQDARRIAIRAQGLAHGRPAENSGGPVATGPVTLEDVSRTVRAMGLLQIDSVNVCVRSHYMPLFSRLGNYDMDLLDTLAYKEKSIFETWAHVASFVPVEHHNLFRQKMAAQQPRHRVAGLIEENPDFLKRALDQVRRRGSMTASELDGAGKRRGPWWGYTTGKIAMEWHFATGELSVARRDNFTRYYDLTERVIPVEHLNGSTPSVEESHREMMRIAVQAHGVGTVADLADYYRIKKADAKARLGELVEEGSAQRVNVDGWSPDEEVFAPNEITPPGPTSARALLTPFDPLVWDRDRIERLFDFFYRIEIYVPEKKRQYGYYVYPFVLGEDIVARVDLKAERDKGVLRVKGAFIEDGQDHDYVAANLADELRLMAGWLGLSRVGTGRRGDLMPALRTALKR